MEVQILWIRLVSIALNTFTGRMAPHQFLVGSWLWHQPGNCQRTQEHWSRPSHHPLLPREAVNLWHLSDTEQASLSPTVWQACRLWGRVFCLHDVFFFLSLSLHLSHQLLRSLFLAALPFSCLSLKDHYSRLWSQWLNIFKLYALSRSEDLRLLSPEGRREECRPTAARVPVCPTYLCPHSLAAPSASPPPANILR